MASLISPRYLTHLTFLKTHHTTSYRRRTTLPPSVKIRRHSSTPMASTTTETAAEVPTTSDVIVQYVVLRRDLIDTWPLGSVVTQGCHASVAAIWAHKDDPQTVEYCSPDKIDSMHKVTLEVKGEVQLKNLSEKLTSNNIDHKLWIEQPENYPTCLATKPYPKSLVLTFFKKLKLYMVQEDEDEDVQEVDVRGKKIGMKKPRENWPPEQEVALAKAWIQVSECKKFSKEQKQQKPEGFWKRVFEHYATTLGSTSRTFHGLNTKWKTMNAAMVIFNGYYLQAKRAKASGCNDMDVMKVAFADYQTKTKKQFSHMLAWEVVKDHAKWVEQDCFQEIGGSASNSLKRKPGEYESTCNENIIPDMIEDQIPPFDSTKSKKKQGASSSSVSSVADDISSYTQRKREYLDEKRERDKLAASLLATQLDGVKFKNRQREMKFFFEPHDHITDPVYLEVILAEKREIAKKNGWRCDF